MHCESDFTVFLRNFNTLNLPILSMSTSFAIVVIFTFNARIHSVFVTSTLTITPLIIWIKQFHWSGWFTMAGKTASAAFIFGTRLCASMTRTMAPFSMWIMWSARSTWKFTFIVRCSTISMTLPDKIRSILNRLTEWKKIESNIYLLHAFESFDEWLSTELDRIRCVGTLEFFRDDADRTDLGLEFTPNKPFCWDRDQGALRVLRGESGALALP